MPLVEATASVDTACISTAPVFGKLTKGGSSSDGSPKTHDSGWWKISTHLYPMATDSTAQALQSVLWFAWLLAMLSLNLVPFEHFSHYLAAATLGVALTQFIPDDGTTVIPYYIHLVIPGLVIKSFEAGGLWSLSIFVFIFVVVPILDYAIGVDVTNQTREQQRNLNGERRFRWQTLFVVPCVAAMIAYGAYLVNTTAATATTLEFVGLSLSVGVYTGAIGITTGHELCHKAGLLEPMCGRALLVAVTYGHFYVEHTLGHHKDVATDLDPATARYGESFWAFLPRVVVGEFRSAWRIERARLERKGLSWVNNEIFMYYVVSACMCVMLVVTFGPWAAPFFALQSLMAIILFETVNYLEHYGLERRIVSTDKTTGKPVQYEPVQPQHSWDSPCRLTNMILLKLQRHADHHAHAGKRYQSLQAYDESPQLPSGYATCILLSFIPPLWRAVMHPRLHAFRKTQKGQVWRHGPTLRAD